MRRGKQKLQGTMARGGSQEATCSQADIELNSSYQEGFGSRVKPWMGVRISALSAKLSSHVDAQKLASNH